MATAPRNEDFPQRWAGLQAHNRWLADFCDDAPGRRAGVAQILLNDVDAAVAEVRWAREAGLWMRLNRNYRTVDDGEPAPDRNDE